MAELFDFDGTLKDLFQIDQPSLLYDLTGGVKVRAFLNVEFPKVQERRVDLVLLLENDTILHVEIQSTNDGEIGLRMMIYYALIKRMYRLPVKQVVLFVGSSRLTMVDTFDEDGNHFGYEVLDLRKFNAIELAASRNPADIALAVLAGGGSRELKAILKRAARLKGAARERLLAQILILSGLRNLASEVEWELRRMGVVIDVTKNPVLMRWKREAVEEGREVGREEGLEVGREEGHVQYLTRQLQRKFGKLPKWAELRVAQARPVQVARWADKILTAATLEQVLGKR